jgi:hypothetical protein
MMRAVLFMALIVAAVLAAPVAIEDQTPRRLETSNFLQNLLTQIFGGIFANLPTAVQDLLSIVLNLLGMGTSP